MQSTNLAIGSYGIGADTLLGSFEDECVGSPPAFTKGIVVSRIEGEKVFVREWCINSHFTGEHALEQFEEAKTHHAFDFIFSDEREMQQSDCFEGADPVLQQQLRNKLKKLK